MKTEQRRVASNGPSADSPAAHVAPVPARSGRRRRWKRWGAVALGAAKVSGTIKELSADFNTVVRKGQVIARIDPALFEAAVNQARADVKAAQSTVLGQAAQVEQAHTNVDNARATRAEAGAQTAKVLVAVVDARRTRDRQTELFERGLVAAADRDSAQSAHDAAVAQHASALAHARINLDHTTIRSPVDGVVVNRAVDVGQTVAATLQAPTLFTIAQDLTRMQVEASLDEADIGPSTEIVSGDFEAGRAVVVGLEAGAAPVPTVRGPGFRL